MRNTYLGKAFVALLVMGMLCPVSNLQAARSGESASPHSVKETSGYERAGKVQEKQVLTLGQLIKKYPDTFKIHGPYVKQIALTFDDCPDPRFTPQVLRILSANRVKATFFVVGSRAKKHPDIVARIVREGHVIGNHSYNHPQFHKLTMTEYMDQIVRTENILYGITGYKPKLIRPPYGDITETQLRWAKREGYKIVNWDVDSLDWKGLSKEAVKRNIMSTASRGSIILQHAGGGSSSDLSGTIGALPEVIRDLKKKGYTFVTVPNLLKIQKDK
ncbi:polysaccharide deacetylase family protein [Paenibacillus sp.]|jgi:peptidoglycan/xylan/chitin deacetylase (PgdA/CDA1 family)|uniref:polysaccharide deacetylase family protein n=1 Tax=Paenibacillus sp. TaxID=58172 RepID=UPI002819E77B|nr:polysaccharide deacetylase family protein [Paenibacillus sp.]MDR0267590.1 polysaccharide deacetylase family protein [Paenibacillus sp.]